MAGILQQLGVSIVEPLLSIWDGIISTAPGVVAAILILIVGYIIAVIIGKIVDTALQKIDFDKWVLEKTTAKKALGAFQLSRFLALITKWYVFILFLPPAANVIALQPLATFLLAVALWVPSVIVAVILALFGVVAAMYVERKIVETKAKAAKIVGSSAKWIIYVFTALIVLDQIGVKVAVAQSSFLIILAGVMLAIALILGIGFGWAFRDEAKKIIQDIKRKL